MGRPRRAELARTNVSWSRGAGLTQSEQRVAELAASGMTNRDVAAALFISLKTVEANMSRIYRVATYTGTNVTGNNVKDPKTVAPGSKTSATTDTKSVTVNPGGDAPGGFNKTDPSP